MARGCEKFLAKSKAVFILRWLLNIWRSGRPHCCSGDIVWLSKGFRRSAMIEDNILYSVFRRDMGRHWLTDFGFVVFGMSLIRANRWEGVSSDRRKELLKVWSRVVVRIEKEL